MSVPDGGYDDLLSRIQKRLREKLGEERFSHFLKGLRIESIEDGVVHCSLGTETLKKLVRRYFATSLSECLREEGIEAKIHFSARLGTVEILPPLREEALSVPTAASLGALLGKREEMDEDDEETSDFDEEDEEDSSLDLQVEKKITIEEIQKLICNEYPLSHDDLIGSKKVHRILRPRQIAMYLSKHLTEHSAETIGKFFGGRNANYVSYAVQKIRGEIESIPRVKAELLRLEERLRERLFS